MQRSAFNDVVQSLLRREVAKADGDVHKAHESAVLCEATAADKVLAATRALEDKSRALEGRDAEVIC